MPEEDSAVKSGTARIVEKTVSLSPLQNGLFLQSLVSRRPVYIQQLFCHVDSALDVRDFQKAWQQVLDRHEIFRAAFRWKDLPEPAQDIFRWVEAGIQQVDLRSLCSDEQNIRIADYLRKDQETPFDLAAPPLIRMALLELADDHYCFLFTHHHAVLDGRSRRIAIEEAFRIYDALRNGNGLRLAAATQFSDYISWLNQQDWEVGRSYWKDLLEGWDQSTPVAHMAGINPAANNLSDNRTWPLITVGESVVSRLETFSRSQGCTLNTLLQACWAILLHRYSGEKSITFGATRACRRLPIDRMSSLVGLFINTVPLRARFAPTTTIAQILEDLRGQSIAARPFESTPLAKIREFSGIDARQPVFETIVVYENRDPNQIPELSGYAVVPRDVRRFGTDPYPLSLFAIGNTSLSLEIGYDAALFDSRFIRRLAGHYLTLLESLPSMLSVSVADLPLLSDAEVEQIVVEWNQTQTDYPVACVHELFETQAAKTPRALAIDDQQTHLTYEELSNRSSQLAHYLVKRGIGPETPVGVCMNRSPQMIVALLAILKAGGAYVPLDPGYPLDRLDFMIADSGIDLLLTKKESLRWLEQDTTVIDLDEEWGQIGGESTGAVRSQVTPQNLAYMIYTSGSTGKPKGVAVEHRQVCNQLFWAGSALSLDSSDRVLFKASFSFDASILEIFLPLAYGAQIIMAKPGGEHDPDYLLRLAVDGGVTYCDIVPSLLDVLLDHPSIKEWKCLRLLTCGAEALKPDLVRRFYDVLSCPLWNTYGPTEATVQSTFALCTPNQGYVPIGKPIANTTLHVLDRNRRPVPVGIAGELYIGGAGVARGYWRRPEITAEKFVPDENCPGARLYRTGDAVRYRHDGNLEFLGRTDRQVKIRGFRIELEEIEALLLRDETVSQAAVIAIEDQNGKKGVRAFLVAKSQCQPHTHELRTLLQQKLPAYMIPESFVILPQLPRLPNGKLDHNALAACNGPAESSGPPYEPPETPIEELLADLWSKILKTGPIGRHESFLDRGGHSLLAMQLISRIRALFRVDLQQKALLQFPTIAALSAHLLAQPGFSSDAQPLVLRRESRSTAPIGMAQQRLWLLQQLEPENWSYNVPTVLRLEGELNHSALERSLEEIIRRHESLRTRFEQRDLDEAPVQLIDPVRPITIPLVDLSRISHEQANLRAQGLIGEEVRKPFDLQRGPLVRALLLRLTPSEHVFVLVIHHMVMDDWSMRLLAKEFSVLYAAFSAGGRSPLPEPPIQYSDYVMWQREWLTQDVLRRQLEYWRNQLSGDIERLRLPAVDAGHSAPAPGAGRVVVELPVDLLNQLRKLARAEDVTLFMCLLAGLQTLLHRYSGQNSIIIGTPVASRGVPEAEHVIGFFLNTLAVRCDLSGNPSVRELLRRVRTSALEAYAHQDVPFEKVVEELQPERDSNKTPLLHAMMVLENTADLDWQLSGLTVEAQSVDLAKAKLDLTLNVQIGSGLTVSFIHSTDVLEQGTVERMARSFGSLLEQMTLDSNARVGDLRLLSDPEFQQTVVDWNRTTAPYSSACIHHLFEKQAAITPERLAVECDGKWLSYADLNRQANQFAHYLIKRGIQREELVGICMDRTVEMVVALLAILKAGGAYVPLDPRYPPDRLAFILQAAQVPAVVTQDQQLDRLSSSTAKILRLSQLWPDIRMESSDNPNVPVSPDNLSYLIYTSGSTGRPKGVAIEHRNAVLLLNWAHSLFSEKDLAGVLASTSICFDLSVFEIFAPLSWGGTVYLVDNVLELPEASRRNQISLVNSVPSLIAEVLRHSKMPPCVKTVNLAGEPLPTALVAELYEQHHVERVFDLYGPSEDTTYSTFTLRDPKAPPVIGRPLPNKTAYILDKYQQPVPAGVAGELYIGGDGVARGYLGQPDLTAERFVPDPFSDKPGARLYRTGDEVRIAADGNLEFRGRLDQQVKIRGFRIELGEIESVLHSHPGVRQAVVIVETGETGWKRLVAYVVPNPEKKPEVASLREFLRLKVPDYMVPSFFVLLEKIPTNPNGKIDRKALPKPVRVGSGGYQAPRDSVESIVAAVWEEILGVQCVGIGDNFFDLGGHSMLLLRLQSKLERTLNRRIPILTVFQHPTVESLAAYVGELLHTPPQTSVIPAAERVEFLPLSYQEEMVWALCQVDSRHLAYNVIRGVRLIGPLDIGALNQAWIQLIERHEILRTGFALQGNRPSRVIRSKLPLDLPVVDLQTLRPEQREEEALRIARLECNSPFALNAIPLFRVRLFRFSPTEHALCITFHHIIVDALSLSVLLEELSALYVAISRGDSPSLPQLPLQYADYAAWQRDELADRLPELDRYWATKLDGLTGQPNLRPRHRERPKPCSDDPHFAFHLTCEETESLKLFSREEKTTLFSVLLAVFYLWMYHETGVTDIAVGVPVANRNYRDLERMVGMFSNLLILRTDLSNTPTFRQLLLRVQKTAQEGYVHQEMPFKRLVERLRPDPDHKLGKLFQMKFVFISEPDRNLEIPGFITDEFPVTTAHQAGNEMSLYIREEDGTLGFVVTHKSTVLTHQEVKGFSEAYKALLAEAVMSPDQRIDRFLREAVAGANLFSPDGQNCQMSNSHN